MISTSHIGNILLPGSSAAINTTFNFTTEAPATASNSSNCTSTTPYNTISCPASNSAVVGGALGGILGAALIGALVALAFVCRSRKHYAFDLAGTKAALTTTETQAAEDKANFHKQFEDQQRHMQSIPPTYNHEMMSANSGYAMPVARGYNGHSQSGTYSPASRPGVSPPTELPHGDSYGYSELGGDDNNSKVELTT